MKLHGRAILIVISLSLVLAAGLYAFRTLARLPDVQQSYAAWDTGKLLVSYLRTHDHRWPPSWDDLIAGVDLQSGPPLLFRRGGKTQLECANALRKLVRVDWLFNPQLPNQQPAVTQPDGAPLSLFWEDPNEMVRAELRCSATAPSIH